MFNSNKNVLRQAFRRRHAATGVSRTLRSSPNEILHVAVTLDRVSRAEVCLDERFSHDRAWRAPLLL
jgi:hypothetical protein